MIFIVAKSQGQLIAAIQTALTLKKLGEVDIDIVTKLPAKGIPVNVVDKSEFKNEVSAGDHFFKLPKKTPKVYTGQPFKPLTEIKKDFDGIGMNVVSSNHVHLWSRIGKKAMGKKDVFYSIDALKQRL